MFSKINSSLVKIRSSPLKKSNDISWCLSRLSPFSVTTEEFSKAPISLFSLPASTGLLISTAVLVLLSGCFSVATVGFIGFGAIVLFLSSSVIPKPDSALGRLRIFFLIPLFHQ